MASVTQQPDTISTSLQRIQSDFPPWRKNSEKFFLNINVALTDDLTFHMDKIGAKDDFAGQFEDIIRNMKTCCLMIIECVDSDSDCHDKAPDDDGLHQQLGP